ncbi:LysR substrate-binding domain-containing protein [uncultured Novosphingobium sp.]|uniref:LysR substrate-binding domain-containing protein n=2 Tax=Novosphingobium TaxID=165696 RepID=UPI002621B15A|nr:LysR substrate-binding domain-containing protein [uncultured Novosphingobium sp.]
MLVAIRRQYPKLSIELVASDAVDDLLQRRADIAIRMVDPVQQALVARRIGTVQLGLYAHRDYLDRRGLPQSIAELPGHDLIGVASLCAPRWPICLMTHRSPLRKSCPRSLPGRAGRWRR